LILRILLAQVSLLIVLIRVTDTQTTDGIVTSMTDCSAEKAFHHK